MKIVVIDYGSGNLASVYNALKFLKANPVISDSPDAVKKADKLILPGVGTIRDAMEGLNDRGLVKPIKDALSEGKPYLGICLGLQMLFDESEEGRVKGLGIVKGKVRRFQEKDGIKVPHIGWNTIDYRPKTRDNRLAEGIKDGTYFYFDHSYYVQPEDSTIIATTTQYGSDFVSAICKKNIYAVQFHPERSQGLGLKLLKNFINL